MIPLYNPQEMIRLELLCYDNPEGLHPIEASWRDLCRKLMCHVQDSDSKLEEALTRVSYKSDWQKEFKPFKFPVKFEPK